MNSTARVTRALAVVTVAAGLAHLPVTPEHLEEAPYVGVSFAVFAAVCLLAGGYLWVRPTSRRVITFVGGLCAVALATYAATRLVAFPQIGDDVGNWLEPWGIASIALEAAAVALAVLSDRAVAAASRPAHAVPVAGSAGPLRAAA